MDMECTCEELRKREYPPQPEPCPFEQEIHDRVRLCDCCPACRHECAQDI